MKYVVCYSGGHSSALAAVETVRRYGKEKVILLNHNISSQVESKEIKIFKDQVADYLRLPITYANCEGFEAKTPLSLCLEHGIIKFRSGCEICTYYLKTKPFYQWLEDNYPCRPGERSDEIKLLYGFDNMEGSRIIRRRTYLDKMGYQSMYPLAEWYRTICKIEDVGIQRPTIYREAKHANCIGCLKAGKQHWYRVYCCRPDIFCQAKQVEEEIGYSIINGFYMKELELVFEKMKRAGMPATENMDSYWFWRYAKQ